MQFEKLNEILDLLNRADLSIHSEKKEIQGFVKNNKIYTIYPKSFKYPYPVYSIYYLSYNNQILSILTLPRKIPEFIYKDFSGIPFTQKMNEIMEEAKNDIQIGLININDKKKQNQIINFYENKLKKVLTNINKKNNFWKSFYINDLTESESPFVEVITQEKFESEIKKIYIFQLKTIKELLHFVESLETELENKNIQVSNEKIKWLGKPAQFSYIFNQLLKRGYIELPSTSGEGSMRKFAKICFQYFDINSETEESFIKAIQKCSLSESNQAKFTIPDIKEIS